MRPQLRLVLEGLLGRGAELKGMELGYTNDTLIKALIANSLMSKTGDTLDELGDVLNIGNTLDYNLVTTSLMATFAQDARMTIDRAINGLYATPLRKVADLEMSVVSIANDNASAVLSSEASALSPGDQIVITDGDQTETHAVSAISFIGLNVTVQFDSSLIATFDPDLTRVVRVDYPVAVKFIATRLTTANIFDKLFTAQADKQESQYGKFFREMANQQLNDILAGATILHGQMRIANLTTPPNMIKPIFPQMGGKGEPYKLQNPGRGG